jgi:hypothetical protein
METDQNRPQQIGKDRRRSDCSSGSGCTNTVAQVIKKRETIMRNNKRNNKEK